MPPSPWLVEEGLGGGWRERVAAFLLSQRPLWPTLALDEITAWAAVTERIWHTLNVRWSCALICVRPVRPPYLLLLFDTSPTRDAGAPPCSNPPPSQPEHDTLSAALGLTQTTFFSPISSSPSSASLNVPDTGTLVRRLASDAPISGSEQQPHQPGRPTAEYHLDCERFTSKQKHPPKTHMTTQPFFLFSLRVLCSTSIRCPPTASGPTLRAPGARTAGARSAASRRRRS